MMSIKEHSLQKIICKILDEYKIMHFQTDVMDGLKFCISQNARIKFINHHKAMGYMNGQSDLVLVLPKRVVFVEVKNGKVGKQSAEQKRFEEKIIKLGHEYLVWRSVQDCEDFIKKDLKLLKIY